MVVIPFKIKFKTQIIMDKHEIGANAGKVWQLLSNNVKWSIKDLQETAGLSEVELYSAIGWLARENKIDFDNSDKENPCVYLYVNIFFG